MDLSPASFEPSARTGAAPRRVGIEIEFLGPGAGAAVAALERALGGSVEREDAHAFRLRGSRLGDLAVDLDLRYAHPQRHPALGWRLGARGAAALGHVLAPVVPRELITAPLPVERVPELDEVVSVLRRAGARGHGAILNDSLGLHLNIDPPALDAGTITALLKAFVLLAPSLRAEIASGSARLARVLPADYPADYARRVLAPDYWPDLDRLAADYLAANPTRRRALDLLPLLTFLDEGRVRAALPHEKIGPRPAMHYRLPLAHVGEPGWSLVPDWERWRSVERLAADRDRLAAEARRVIQG
jgi:hypothetical protein